MPCIRHGSWMATDMARNTVVVAAFAKTEEGDQLNYRKAVILSSFSKYSRASSVHQPQRNSVPILDRVAALVSKIENYRSSSSFISQQHCRLQYHSTGSLLVHTSVISCRLLLGCWDVFGPWAIWVPVIYQYDIMPDFVCYRNKITLQL